MKSKVSIWSVALLALAMAGCKQPTDPAFAPDGRTLVFEKNGNLILRSSNGDRVISEDVEGPVSWSPDGSKVAFSRNNGTTIYDLATGKSVGSSKYTFPYAWHEGMLAGVRAYGNEKDATIYTVSPNSAEPHLQVTVPFHPDRIDMLGQGTSLLWAGEKAYWFDGLGATELPQLRGMNVMVPQRRDGQWLLARAFARPHTHRHVVGFYQWSGDPGSKPASVGTLDIASAGGFGEHSTILQDLKVADRGGRMAATFLTLLVKPRDEQVLSGLVDKYDLLNHLGDTPDMSTQDSKRLKAITDRAPIVRIALTGTRGGKWEVLDRVVEPVERKKPDDKSLHLRVAPDLRIGINSDGTRIAVSSDKGTKTYEFPNR